MHGDLMAFLYGRDKLGGVVVYSGGEVKIDSIDEERCPSTVFEVEIDKQYETHQICPGQCG